jgi:hypothetical protein
MTYHTSHYQYFTKVFRSGDFSRFLAERIKSLLRFRDLLTIKKKLHKSGRGHTKSTINKSVYFTET